MQWTFPYVASKKAGKATVVDEAPMTNKLAFEVLDRTLRDLTGKSQPMGGMCMLLCGDFRQILPVNQGGTRGNIVDSCLKSLSCGTT